MVVHFWCLFIVHNKYTGNLLRIAAAVQISNITQVMICFLIALFSITNIFYKNI